MLVVVNLISGVKMASLYLMDLTSLACLVICFISIELVKVRKGSILVVLVMAVRLCSDEI